MNQKHFQFISNRINPGELLFQIINCYGEMRKTLFTLCFVFIQTCLFGQQTNKDTLSYQIDSVVVSASRYEQPVYQIPFSIDVIGLKVLNSSYESLSAENIFRSIPGIIVNDRYNLSEGDRIIIRGIGSRSQFGVRGIKILLDGIPLTFADGQSQLNNLDLNSIGRIEVIRGPSSFLYGNSAGGVIYIQSKDVDAQKFSVSPSYTSGSFGLRKFSLNASGRIGKNSLLVGFNRMNYNGFRENSAASTTAFNLISSQNFSSVINLKAVFNYFDAPYLLNPSSLTKSDAENTPSYSREFVKQQGAGKKIRQGQAGLTFSYQPEQEQRFEITFYGVSRSMLNPIPGNVIRLNRIAGGIRSDYSTHIQLDGLNFRILAGSDFEFQNDVRTEFANNGLSDYKSLPVDEIIDNVRLGETQLDQKEKVSGWGAFAKLEFSPIEKLFMSFGLRYDKYNFDVEDRLLSDGDNSGSLPMNNLSPMIGAVYSLNSALQVYANYSTSFQTPTTSELSNTANGQGGFNTSLKPEQLKNFEIGARGNLLKGNFYYDVSIYKILTNNILIPYQQPGSQSDVVYFRNSGSAVNNGIEVSMLWVPQHQWNINFAYTYSDFKFNDFTESVVVGNNNVPVNIGGKRVPGIPQNNLSFGLSYKFSFGLNAGISLNRCGRFYVNDTNGPVPNSAGNLSDFINDAYFTANMNIAYDFDFALGSFELFTGINNLFDARYCESIVPNAANNRFFEPAASRNWNGGLTIKFN